MNERHQPPQKGHRFYLRIGTLSAPFAGAVVSMYDEEGEAAAGLREGQAYYEVQLIRRAVMRAPRQNLVSREEY